MLNRKPSKLVNGADTHGRNGQRNPSSQERRPRRRFIISAKAAGRADSRPQQVRHGLSKPPSLPGAKIAAGAGPLPAGASAAAPADLAETIKTLLHLAHENGHITYDDINDVLPEGMSPEDLDELYTKLRGLDVEIVDHAEVERAKPAEPE
jgi:hypothetical protein